MKDHCKFYLCSAVIHGLIFLLLVLLLSEKSRPFIPEDKNEHIFICRQDLRSKGGGYGEFEFKEARVSVQPKDPPPPEVHSRVLRALPVIITIPTKPAEISWPSIPEIVTARSADLEVWTWKKSTAETKLIRPSGFKSWKGAGLGNGSGDGGGDGVNDSTGFGKAPAETNAHAQYAQKVGVIFGLHGKIGPCLPTGKYDEYLHEKIGKEFAGDMTLFCWRPPVVLGGYSRLSEYFHEHYIESFAVHIHNHEYLLITSRMKILGM